MCPYFSWPGSTRLGAILTICMPEMSAGASNQGKRTRAARSSSGVQHKRFQRNNKPQFIDIGSRLTFCSYLSRMTSSWRWEKAICLLRKRWGFWPVTRSKRSSSASSMSFCSELVDELCVVCLVSSPYLNGGLCSHTDRLDGPIIGNFAGDVPRVDDLLLGFGLVVRGWHGCRRVLVRPFSIARQGSYNVDIQDCGEH